jgi:hypothetical protein
MVVNFFLNVASFSFVPLISKYITFKGFIGCFYSVMDKYGAI